MTHEDALKEMSVERYLLGELTGESRDTFEEHLFECQLCAADVTAGVTFAQAARVELAPQREQKLTHGRFAWLDSILRPVWLAPAVSLCILVILYQNSVVLPHLRQQAAKSEAPRVLNSLVLAGGTTRGDQLPRVSVPQGGIFLLSIDIPAAEQYTSYDCSLFAPSGRLVWKATVPPEQVKDTMQISIPAASTEAGENTVLIQGARSGGASGVRLEDVVRRKFVLTIQK